MSRDSDTSIGGAGERFPTTVLDAIAGTREADPQTRLRSLDALVAAYWKPVYKYVRVRWRSSNEDAKDLTQGFFERAAHKGTFAAFDPDKGRFRTFLRHCLDQYVANERKAGGRLKRGGGATHWSLDFENAEAEIDRLDLERQADLEAYFDREWYRSVLSQAVDRLREQCDRDGKREHFLVLERYDLCDGDPPTYAELGAELGIAATTVTNRLAYARRELKRLAVGIVASVTATERELDAEVRLLFEDGP
jgi:RNA polymerase sigma factor (sigma-70 family)